MIALGEVIAGLCYLYVGVVFLINAIKAIDSDRTWFRGVIGLLFVVGGLEEIGDAIFEEGSGQLAIWMQGILTGLQVITGGLCAWAIVKVKFMSNYR